MAFEPMSFSILVWCSAIMNTANVKLLSWDIFGGKSVYDIFSQKLVFRENPRIFFAGVRDLSTKNFFQEKNFSQINYFFFEGGLIFLAALDFFETFLTFLKPDPTTTNGWSCLVSGLGVIKQWYIFKIILYGWKMLDWKIYAAARTLFLDLSWRLDTIGFQLVWRHHWCDQRWSIRGLMEWLTATSREPHSNPLFLTARLTARSTSLNWLTRSSASDDRTSLIQLSASLLASMMTSMLRWCWASSGALEPLYKLESWGWKGRAPQPGHRVRHPLIT